MPARILATLVGAAMFALIFSGPVRLIMKGRMPSVTFGGVFIAVSMAIFVEYWLAAAGGGLIYAYITGAEPSIAVTAILVIGVSFWTFLVGAWLLGWTLGAPSHVRFEHGAMANAVVLLCNGALVAIAFGLDRMLR